MNFKKKKIFTSKFVGTGPSSYTKRIYRAAVSQRLRNTAQFCVSLSWFQVSPMSRLQSRSSPDSSSPFPYPPFANPKVTVGIVIVADDGGSIFLCNVGYLPHYIESYQKKNYFHNRCHHSTRSKKFDIF